MTNNFPLNDEESKQYRPLLRYFYDFIEPGREIEYYDAKTRFEQTIQRILHIDLSIATERGKEGYEEKVVRPQDGKPYAKIYAETESCTNPGLVSGGWMKTCLARFLVYVMVTRWGLVIYLIDFPDYKTWFWKELKAHPSCFQRHRNPEENQSQGVLVPIADLNRYGWVKRYWLTFNEVCRQIDMFADIEDLAAQEDPFDSFEEEEVLV